MIVIDDDKKKKNILKCGIYLVFCFFARFARRYRDPGQCNAIIIIIIMEKQFFLIRTPSKTPESLIETAFLSFSVYIISIIIYSNF